MAIQQLSLVEQVAKRFRAQPIVTADSMKLVGMEMLSRERLNFGNRDRMLRVDINALKAASIMARQKVFGQVHCNAEILSMTHLDWIETAALYMVPGIVVEVVERHELMRNPYIAAQVANSIMLVRHFGGIMAMDDMALDDESFRIMEQIKPEIIKLDSVGFVQKIRDTCNARIVVERIETLAIAEQAQAANADMLQGYYCDVVRQDTLPSMFTPPGVEAALAAACA